MSLVIVGSRSWQNNALIQDDNGPAALSPLEVDRLFEQVGKKAFELQFVPEIALQMQLNALEINYASNHINSLF